MTATFTPVSLPQVAPPDPGKHVNYQTGMVLGADDFVQEFTYLSGRDKRIVRDLLGSGVVTGLGVSVDVSAADGPRVNVAPGELVTPSGQLVCVSPAQCANLNDWLAANRDAVEALTSPPPSSLPLAVVACYAECLTDDVPIPGEPCRSDDELSQPSRVKDSFSLELRTAAPEPGEAEAVRAFVTWVRRIAVVDAPAGDVAAFTQAARTALLPDASPPVSLLDLLAAPPPASLKIPRAAAGQYLAALFGLWVSDLRAHARGTVPGAECGCGCGAADPADECLRIAELTVPLVVDSVSGALLVDGAKPVLVEPAQPLLLQLQLVQEWLLAAAEAAEAAPAVVAGRFAADGTTIAARGGLAAHAIDATSFQLTFPAFSAGASYVVTGQPAAATADAAASTFEVIAQGASPPPAGIVVRVRKSGGGAVPGGFAVRIEEL